MMRRYEYEGFALEVTVESDISLGLNKQTPPRPGYVAVVRIFRAGQAVAVFSPLRFGETGGRPFATEADAIKGGYAAARKIVEDLFRRDGH